MPVNSERHTPHRIARGVVVMCAVGILSLAGLCRAEAAFGPDDSVRTNPDGSVRCIENGTKFVPSASDPFAPAQSCYFSEPSASAKASLVRIATKKDVYPSPEAARAALERTENTSPLAPGSQLAKDSFFYQPLTGSEPIDPYSDETSRETLETNVGKGTMWATGANFGGVGDSYLGGQESIAVFTVDSANPEQHYVTVVSNDPRVTANATSQELMTGRIPLPKWAADQLPTSSGDGSIAIYDVATGLYREMFRVHPVAGAADTFTFASGGYVQARPHFAGFGTDNFWGTLMTGTSSVVGLTNSLTQISPADIRSGSIDHMVSMTWQDYTKVASFPAKDADGRVDPVRYPRAPHAGQVFTLPQDFDVDAYADTAEMGELDRMYLHAIQNYGAIITDRNAVINAVNFAHPAGVASYARRQQNVYTADPSIARSLRNYQPNRLPYTKFQWIRKNYAGAALLSKSSPVKRNILPDLPRMADRQLLVRDLHSSIYEGEFAYTQFRADAMINNGNEVNGPFPYGIEPDGSYSWKQTKGTARNGVLFMPEGYAQFKPDPGFLGTGLGRIYPGWTFNGGTFDGPTADNKRSYSTWYVDVVRADQPKSATDLVSVNAGRSTTVAVLDNDMTAKGQDSSGFASIELLDDRGVGVRTRSVGGTVFTVQGKQVVVAAGARDNGYLPYVRYRARTSDGRTSIGYIGTTITQPRRTLSMAQQYNTPDYQMATMHPGGVATMKAPTADGRPLPAGTRITGNPRDLSYYGVTINSDNSLRITAPRDLPLGNATLALTARYPDGSEHLVRVRIGVLGSSAPVINGGTITGPRTPVRTMPSDMRPIIPGVTPVPAPPDSSAPTQDPVRDPKEPPAGSSTQTTPPAKPSTVFTDVKPGVEHYAAMVWMKSSGISTGYPDGTYRPYVPVNRDAMAAFLYRMAGSPAVTLPSRSPFKDVPPASEHYTAIIWAQRSGVTTGWPDGTFRPTRPIARDAMAAFMYRYAGSPTGPSPSSSPFSDVSAGQQFVKEMTWMRASGVSTGWPDGSYRPAESVKRDAMAAFLYRYATKK